jgi:hypothetical protein
MSKGMCAGLFGNASHAQSYLDGTLNGFFKNMIPLQYSIARGNSSSASNPKTHPASAATSLYPVFL